MELLNVMAAKSVWLFDINDLNPQGKSFIPDLFAWLTERYQFRTFPKSPSDLDETKGLAFKEGTGRTDEGDPINFELTIYNDGVIANTWSSTRYTDAFIEQVLSGASKQFGLAYTPTMFRSKTHISELVFRMDRSLTDLDRRLNDFARELTKAFATESNLKFGPFIFSGLSFAIDSSSTSLKPASFAIERRIGAPFSENRFYSKSPLHTDNHLAALNAFELLLL